ncbi:MAG: CBS domain-containing protein [Gemmatimonadota bacterium]|nr:CBS domain-containing protein [Gemmatimonadota bacterium]MDE2676769.1 CBS domain-containing protein [Gemmatimonadota bacterium]
MGTVRLAQLVVHPGVAAGTEADPWECLTSGAVDLPGHHAAAAAALRVSRAGVRPHSIPLASRAGLMNLGSDAGDPGIVFLLTPVSRARDADQRGTWVVWGLPRPSVNLFLGPALNRLTPATGENTGPEATLQIIESKQFSDIDIVIDVTVGHVLQPLVYRVYPDAPMHEVQYLMLRRGLATIPVVGKDHEMLGVIAVSDVLSHILPGSEGSAERRSLVARDIMKRAVLCVSEGESLVEASRSMIARQVSRLPVVREGRLVGFLDRGVVLRAFADTLVIPSTARPPG